MITAGLSDCHEPILSSLKVHFKRLPVKKIFRDYENFSQYAFLYEVKQEMIEGIFYKSKDLFDVSPLVFRSVIDKPVCLKQKVIRGKFVPFLNKELSKASMNHLRIRTRYLNWPSGEQILNCKKINLIKKAERTCLNSVSSKNMAINKHFWNQTLFQPKMSM